MVLYLKKGSKMKYFYIAIFLLFISLNIYPQSDPAIKKSITVSNNNGSSTTLYFGLDAAATDNLDPQLGEANLPPLPPATAWDTRLLLPEGDFSGVKSSYSDFRNATSFPYTGSKEHRIQYQVGSGTTITIAWDLPAEITGVLQDIVTGTLITVPMSGVGNYVVTQPTIFNKLKMIINYQGIVVTDVKENIIQPYLFNLEQNYPNPFNPSTKINYSIPASELVQLKVYDLLGNLVVTLVNEIKAAGSYEVEFNANQLGSGIYFYQLRAGNNILTRKMTLVK